MIGQLVSVADPICSGTSYRIYAFLSHRITTNLKEIYKMRIIASVYQRLIIAPCLIWAFCLLFAISQNLAQELPKGDRVPDKSLLQRFDANGDGKIDDNERRAVREKMKQIQNKPGAMTPAEKPEIIGNRTITQMQYPSSDGKLIPCVLSMPQGNGPFPILVTIHGGQGNRDFGYIRSMAAPNGLSPTITAFNEQPWAILAISYRAGNGALFGMEQDDVIAGIRFAKTLPKIDTDRVGVVGGSHGGHLALVAAEKMGREFLCVAAGSPWMTDPVVYMMGDPTKPPLSQVPAKAQEDLQLNGRRISNGMQKGRGLSDQQFQAFLKEHSIEANSDKILVPTLFLTSLGDDQAPHALIEPMIQRMKQANKQVQVYTAEKSPHGFYWARTVSAARDLRGEKTPEEAQEELTARRTIIEFFTAQFARKGVKTDSSSSDQPKPGQSVQSGSAGRGANRAGAGGRSMLPNRKPVPEGGSKQSGQASNGSTTSSDAPKTLPIRIASGELVGLQAGDVRVFRGVPYAAPPMGQRRWQAAEPPQSWSGIRQATEFGAAALQGETFTPRSSQSEDCLFLNIWTPTNATADSKLPVLFWIHGGAFIQGSGAQPRYDGTELAKRGAVVISINYRLGPLGLFAHPALTAQSKPDEPLGNYCLLDMISALRWTQDNISAFGGDPGNITISGSSAGGTSCLFLMGIPQAQGLFHKAIIHSSGGIQNIQTLSKAESAGQRLSERLGLGSHATSADLRRAAPGDVAVGVGAIRELNLPVKPIIDGRLVTASPADTFAQGKQARIPVLIGSANGESGARQFGDEVATGGAFGFQRKLADDMVRAGQAVWMFQLTYVPPGARSSRFAAQHGESVAYAFGTIGQSLAAQYGFRNEQVAKNAARSRRGGGGAGAGREDDSQPVEESEQGRAISSAMLEYWIKFMRDGQPSGQQLPAWPAYNSTAPKTMVFGNNGIGVK
jgi:para-nitrobenzyl esterase